MLSSKMLQSLTDQINAELYSAYLYLAMSARCEALNFPGAAKWLSIQAGEEYDHAEKIMKYIVERRSEGKLQAIKEPPSHWSKMAEVFRDVLTHEQEITKRINQLVELARQEKDYATESFLQWFVDEQVEEESSADAIRQRLEMVGDSVQGLLLMDRELAQRS